MAISDTHNQHDKLTIPEGDVLVHAGDLTARGALADLRAFLAWFEGQPCTHKVFIAGNHDWCFQRASERAQDMVRILTAGHNVIYLEDSEVVIDGVKFYGSPWQPWFFDWAFNLPRGRKLREKWAEIPTGTDVLITHGPPRGYGDAIANGTSPSGYFSGQVPGEHVGCDDLADAVRRVRPKLHIFGHIHEGYGITEGPVTRYVNAASCTLSYRPINPPIVLDI